MFWDSNDATLPLTNVASIQILLGSALLVDIDSTYLIEQVCSNIAIIWPVDQGLFSLFLSFDQFTWNTRSKKTSPLTRFERGSSGVGN